MKKHHHPVLLDEVISLLSPQPGERYLDLTAGYGGHAKAVLSHTKAAAVLVDRDPSAITVLQETFERPAVQILHNDFLSASDSLQGSGEMFDLILADLGVSSPHLDIASRGFSIKADGPLDMRMDQQQALTAATVVNTYDVSELVRILKEYGQEPKAKRIAQLLVANRPLTTTHQLADMCKQAWPGYSRTHPATRAFQAIRIEVNEELKQLQDALPLWKRLLAPGGRLAVISFHSLEDAIVKRYFASESGERYDTELELMTKRPVTAQPSEIVFNPRARSAKLRVAKRK